MYRTSDEKCSGRKDGCEATAKYSSDIHSYRPTGYVFPECNCNYIQAPSSPIIELNYSDRVGSSLMADLSLAWTSGLSSCSFTCELKAASCTDPYLGSFISIDENKINGAQNELLGWDEEVCV